MPYHTQSDRMVERFTRTLIRILKSYVNDHHSDLDDHLPFVIMAYRSVEHETMECSSNYLILGREVLIPSILCMECRQVLKVFQQIAGHGTLRKSSK